ncbi:SufE family protein [Pseudobacteriovorax antillogorgiicola]|uniref:Cysteine desulfuration protein SufE n=1 Tax=Pseudobacteriovorax antillogorgiicola TaxID=1513793 RepID=A0A1Y6BTT3_9BACT|nr:SufE family protein [Pseudobacteriovorax antillogorgiicola]TCS52455.1 cysteine desulfuration protein SufE [Pseudobacteriovorax antillogorgiicola]SMF28462.1 Cysteine desulfuration protein SufE [Pseudobacteriovorax antillogorgiicola]
MQTLEEKKTELTAKLKQIPNKDERLKFIIEQGKAMPPMADKFKIDQFLVKGCISKAWLFPQLKDGRILFHADSEAMIVKGIIAILLQVYSEATPEEVLQEDGSFLADVGVTEHLSMNRRNGLANVLKMIQAYATAFKAQS